MTQLSQLEQDIKTVKEIHPTAEEYHPNNCDGWVIIAISAIGWLSKCCDTQDDAWHDAAERIRRESSLNQLGG